MKENRIEDRINKAYCFLNSMHSDFRTGLYYKEDLENLEHILSDYKKLQEEFKQVDHECERLEEKEVRLIKENEELKSENRRLKVIRYSREYGTENIHLITKSDLVEINTNKYFIEIQDGKFVDLKQVYQENEELKRDRNNNYQMIALAQNEALGYMQGYEDGKKLKRSAVACVVENQQYYIIKKEIEHYKEYIEKLQKENEKYKRLSEMNLKNAEEFKNNMCEHRCLLKSENEELQRENEELKKFITEGITVAPHSTYKNYRLDFLRENFVSKKKIKNKIEELKQEKKKYGNCLIEMYEDELVNRDIKILQELLESEE